MKESDWKQFVYILSDYTSIIYFLWIKINSYH